MEVGDHSVSQVVWDIIIVFVIAQIDCAAILREGPLDGVVEQRSASGGLTGCVAAAP